MAAVLIKTPRLNHIPHIKLRPWYQHPKLWLKFSHVVPAERVSLSWQLRYRFLFKHIIYLFLVYLYLLIYPQVFNLFYKYILRLLR